MNNKGQTLVLFVLILPVIIVAFAFLYDACEVLYQKSKLNNITISTIRYGLDHLDTTNSNELNEMMQKNIANLTDIKITFEDNTIYISTTKKVIPAFSQLINKKEYKIKAHYKGIIENDKKIVLKTS